MFIIDDLLLWLPAKGLIGVFKKIDELAQEEMDNEAKLKKALYKCQMMYDLEMISEKEFEKKQDLIMEKLNRIYQRKKHKEYIK